MAVGPRFQYLKPGPRIAVPSSSRFLVSLDEADALQSAACPSARRKHGRPFIPVLFSGCDVNSPRQPGASGEGEEEARDGQTPLHLAASWGLEETVQCLLEFGANVNAQVRSLSFPGRELVTPELGKSLWHGPYRVSGPRPLLYCEWGL